jgi:uncharacterized protein (DUF697 family)
VPKSKLPLKPAAVLGILRELRAAAQSDRPLVVAGARELTGALRRELVRGGVSSAVREQGSLEDAAALIYILAGEPHEDAVAMLREARKAQVPIICVLTGPKSDVHVPYVLDENVVRVRSGSGFPIEQIARVLARVLGEDATPLAARLPVLRRAVCSELIRRASRQNAVLGAAVFVPGADMPVLTLNEIRLVLRIADAYGFEIDQKRLPEVLGVIASAVGLRRLARQALALVPVAGWAVKGAIAYAGTRAVGEAAVRYFERRAPITRIAGARTLFPR